MGCRTDFIRTGHYMYLQLQNTWILIVLNFAHLQTDHSLKARNQTKQYTTTIVRHKYKLTAFEVLKSTLPPAIPFCLLFLFLQAAKPYRCVNLLNQHFPWAAYVDTTTFFK